ncbi:hypothetical protein D5400_04900 [Georhizobium profundi]|uniref:Uncharacterized protein n=1 Tax=Georhizobium profundi TaxID=2341112 RepID=A0A3Q8XNK1_9HYPH|nr:hypothetical protein [Georhizobium profundi]AZN70701.1 hypothetical protein D5400_04900 [Georhizobium profundi]
MTVKKASVLLDYCSFYISGIDGVRIPLDHDLRGVVSTEDCINVSALPWNEGETTVTLARFEELQPQAVPPRFDGTLNTPDYRVDLFDANIPEILFMDVPSTRTRVRIWMNRPLHPDNVIVALG